MESEEGRETESNAGELLAFDTSCTYLYTKIFLCVVLRIHTSSLTTSVSSSGNPDTFDMLTRILSPMFICAGDTIKHGHEHNLPRIPPPPPPATLPSLPRFRSSAPARLRSSLQRAAIIWPVLAGLAVPPPPLRSMVFCCDVCLLRPQRTRYATLSLTWQSRQKLAVCETVSCQVDAPWRQRNTDLRDKNIFFHFCALPIPKQI